ncbi:MAG: hypothetical protein ABIP15_01315 [Devosia sp.]
MGLGRTNRGSVARETLLALLVLALAFLNFGHASISLGGELKLTPEIWCGDPMLPDSPDHSPCHACRIGSSVDVPPAPVCVEPVSFAVTPVVYADIGAAFLSPVPLGSAHPRGPPILT